MTQDRYPKPPLLPPKVAAAKEAQTLLQQLDILDDPDPLSVGLGSLKPHLEVRLKVLEALLHRSGGEFVLGNATSLLDLALAPQLERLSVQVVHLSFAVPSPFHSVCPRCPPSLLNPYFFYPSLLFTC